MTLNIPSEWTESWESYLEHKEEVVEFINNLLNADPMPKCGEQESILKEEFLGGTALYNIIRGKK